MRAPADSAIGSAQCHFSAVLPASSSHVMRQTGATTVRHWRTACTPVSVDSNRRPSPSIPAGTPARVGRPACITTTGRPAYANSPRTSAERERTHRARTARSPRAPHAQQRNPVLPLGREPGLDDALVERRRRLVDRHPRLGSGTGSVPHRPPGSRAPANRTPARSGCREACAPTATSRSAISAGLDTPLAQRLATEIPQASVTAEAAAGSRIQTSSLKQQRRGPRVVPAPAVPSAAATWCTATRTVGRSGGRRAARADHRWSIRSARPPRPVPQRIDRAPARSPRATAARRTVRARLAGRPRWTGRAARRLEPDIGVGKRSALVNLCRGDCTPKRGGPIELGAIARPMAMRPRAHPPR